MTNDEKIKKLFETFPQIKKYNFTPPLHRLLWKLGINAPPPHFAPFIFNLLFMGIPFGILWGLSMWLVFWRFTNISAIIAVFASIIAGILFGICMAGYYKYTAKKYNLPPWEEIK